MADSIAEIQTLFSPDQTSAWVSNLWDRYNMQRAQKVNEWLELRNYIFATDTQTTTNKDLPWKNSTTLPKLCQIRDNLHSNYVSALFPNDRWLSWQAHTKDAASKSKAETIKAYMTNKCRIGHFRTTCSKLLYDYIDYGNAFATCFYEERYKELASGEVVPSFMGPKASRISPLDIVFDPTAEDFTNSFKVVRSIKTIGELKKLAQTDPDQAFWADVVARRAELRHRLGGYGVEDFNKAVGYSADGFGNMYEYYQGDYVEILEFFGDYHDSESGDLKTNKILTVVDRSYLAREGDIPSWLGHAPIYHVGWRFRPDNLWAMGPLDNLVGMQYRIDHLENLKADAMDLCVHPPLAIIGEVEQFVWGPGAEIHIDEGGSIQELTKSLQGIFAADNQIALLKEDMELMAGAPREAMGIRTPGEKTATEVSQLSNAAGRIFQEKINNFEMELLEPLLNAMLEVAARNLTTVDLINVLDDDLGVQEFRSITKADITANGVLRPVGARHFAKEAQDLQNIIGILASPIGALIQPHTSGKALSKFVNDVTGLKGYSVFSDNIAVTEQQETQSLVNQGMEDMDTEANLPPEEM